MPQAVVNFLETVKVLSTLLVVISALACLPSLLFITDSCMPAHAADVLRKIREVAGAHSSLLEHPPPQRTNACWFVAIATGDTGMVGGAWAMSSRRHAGRALDPSREP
jgi:hypothetical protein